RYDLLGWLSEQSLSNRDYEGIAQTIKQAFDDDPVTEFEDVLQRVLNFDRPRPGVARGAFEADRDRVFRRRDLLRAIPFHSILTTNFDGVLEGAVPSTSVFAEVIGARRRPWWTHQAWSEEAPGRGSGSWHAPVVKLHGDIARAQDRQLVFTTRGYRRLLHADPGYRAFLRTLFATHSVLYLGFSFSDAYINDLRSEVLALIGKERSGARLYDFALLNDVPDRVAAHLRDHEGLECLTFSSRGKTDFQGFDDWLSAIHRETCPESTLRASVAGRRILWLDPEPKNTAFGHRVLRGTAHGAGGAVAVDEATSVESALDRLSAGYDLIISHFGYRGPTEASNLQLLIEGIHRRPVRLRAPVVVFSQPEHLHLNRPLALRLGVFEFVTNWAGLFEVIEQLFADTGRGPSPS
ncbi:MAG: SIR2 family protein, partial [Myxococcota bacterium]